jgi:uncharacterized delta-60 repeat protein
VVQPDGRVVVGGQLASGAGWAFGRLLATGALDATFGSAGWSTVSGPASAGMQAMSLQVLDDGRIAAVTYPIDGAVGPLNEGHVATLRLRADGQPDATYGSAGIVDNAFGYSWSSVPVASDLVLGNGVVVLARSTDAGVAVSRLRPDGSVDSGFGPNPPPFSLAPANSPLLLLQPDASLLLVALPFDATAQQSILKVARQTARGTLDTSFGNLGVASVTMSPAALGTVLATPDGEYAAVVSLQDGSAIQAVKIAADGRLDARFGCGGRTSTPGAAAVDDATMGADGYLTILARKNTPQHDGMLIHMQAVGDVVEFYNSILDHYFMALDGTEAAGIDAGAAGPAWTRTKVAMRPGGLAPVCRFYGTPGIGPNSHFYTAQPAECALVQRDPGWTLEGTGFYTTRVVDAACPAPLVPIHRYYNNRAAEDDSNHRYVRDGDVGLRDFMEARGWIHEGIVFCVKP